MRSHTSIVVVPCVAATVVTVFLWATAASSSAGIFAAAAAIVLPAVPDVLHPATPTGIDETAAQDEDDPELSPGLFQGDIAIDRFSHGLWKVGLRWDIFPERLWPNATVPYAISPLYEATDIVTIRTAMRTLSLLSCVRFVPWDGSAPDYLLIWPIKYPRGCWSYVGRTGGAQIVSLQPPDAHGPNCLGNEGRPLHELMHALGIFHEQSRADRDKFVKVHWDNILPRYRNNFERQSLENTSYAFEYDYGSIMHYGRAYFAKDRKQPTLTAKQAARRRGDSGAKVKLGQRAGLSRTDCLKVNDLYGCLDKNRKKYYAVCGALGV